MSEQRHRPAGGLPERTTSAFSPSSAAKAKPPRPTGAELRPLIPSCPASPRFGSGDFHNATHLRGIEPDPPDVGGQNEGDSSHAFRHARFPRPPKTGTCPGSVRGSVGNVSNTGRAGLPSVRLNWKNCLLMAGRTYRKCVRNRENGLGAVPSDPAKLANLAAGQMLMPDNRISNSKTLPRSIKAQEPRRCSPTCPALSLLARR
jgi:hypothetical protein